LQGGQDWPVFPRKCKEQNGAIKKYVAYNTSAICTDSARQYFGVEKMFSPQTVHKQTNHSKGEFVNGWTKRIQLMIWRTKTSC